MENFSLDESLERASLLCTKLENQARTLAAIRRKSFALAEQQTKVRKNLFKTEKIFSQALIDLNVAAQTESEPTAEQLDHSSTILRRIEDLQKNLAALALISRKGN